MVEDKIDVLKIFKGGSLSSTKLINHPKYNKCVLKKVSNNLNREYGFVRFCSQIKRHSQLRSTLPELFPKILEIGINIKNESAFCIYEYMDEYISVFDFLNYQKISENNLKNAALNILNSLKKLHKNEYDTPLIEGSLEFYLQEEMIRPLIEYEKYLDISNKTFENFKVYKCADTISKIYELFANLGEIKNQKYCMIHGNATLENILIHPKSLAVSFIDVYDETYCDISLSDYSQILQCSKYYYGMRMRNPKKEDGESDYKLMDKNNNFKFFNQIIEDNLNLSREESTLLNLLSASQFIRLLPFRIQNNDTQNAIYFYSLASWILRGSLNE